MCLSGLKCGEPLFNLLIINQTLDQVCHLSFKQNRHNKKISLFSSDLLNTRLKSLNS